MYGKIFESIYEGSLYGDWKAIVTLQQLIVIADEHGIVDKTPEAIAGRTSLPLEIINEGLTALSAPDKRSRSDAYEGRRIILSDQDRDWGWEIVNYKYYRDLASRTDKQAKDRERIAKKRKEIKDVATCSKTSQKSPIHIQDTDTLNISRFDEFWESYPRKEGSKKKAKVTFDNLSKKKQELAITDPSSRYSETEKKYVPYPTTYLNGEYWEQEAEEELKWK